jgi:hypothetical protein
MVARHRRRQPGALFLGLFGCLLVMLGSWHLLRLERTYLPEEILYRASPDTLVLWMASLDVEDAQTAERLSNRFLSMPLPARRDGVLALADNEAWSKFVRKPQDLRSWQRVVLAAANQSVAKAPAAGDLWFLAGVLIGRLEGYGENAQSYLALSATYAPRELELVNARLVVLATAWPLLNERLKVIVQRDLAVMDAAAPQRAQAVKEVLSRSGVTLGD